MGIMGYFFFFIFISIDTSMDRNRDMDRKRAVDRSQIERYKKLILTLKLFKCRFPALL